MFEASVSARIIHTHTLILSESMDCFNEDRVTFQWKALALVAARKVERNMAEQSEHLTIEAIDYALARLIPYLPEPFKREARQDIQMFLERKSFLETSHSIFSKMLKNLIRDPMVDVFAIEARKEQLKRNILPVVWNALDNTLFLDPEFPQNEEITPLLDALTNSPIPENCVDIANQLMAHSVNSADKFNTIWNRVMNTLHHIYTFDL